MAVAAEHLCTEAEWKWELPDATEVGPVPFIRPDCRFPAADRRHSFPFSDSEYVIVNHNRSPNTRSPRELPANVSASARRAAAGRCGSESFPYPSQAAQSDVSPPGRLREECGSIRCPYSRETARGPRGHDEAAVTYATLPPCDPSAAVSSSRRRRGNSQPIQRLYSIVSVLPADPYQEKGTNATIGDFYTKSPIKRYGSGMCKICSYPLQIAMSGLRVVICIL
jgi:hypothetical protein